MCVHDVQKIMSAAANAIFCCATRAFLEHGWAKNQGRVRTGSEREPKLRRRVSEYGGGNRTGTRCLRGHPHGPDTVTMTFSKMLKRSPAVKRGRETARRVNIF